MANVYRIFVEKKKGNDIEAMQILTDLRQNVGITALTGLRLINRYDVQGVSEAEFRRAVHGVFAEDNLDNTADEVTFAPGERVFAMEFLPGQYDQRADSADQIGEHLLGFPLADMIFALCRNVIPVMKYIDRIISHCLILFPDNLIKGLH